VIDEDVFVRSERNGDNELGLVWVDILDRVDEMAWDDCGLCLRVGLFESILDEALKTE